MEIFLTIGIPIYNTNIEYLKTCLNSVTYNIRDNIEIILIDDCSSNEYINKYLDIIKKYQNLKYIRFDKNKGVSVARNTIISLASGKWILFLDSDDILPYYFMNNIYNYLYLDTDLILFKYKSFFKESEIVNIKPEISTLSYLTKKEKEELSKDVLVNKPNLLLEDILAGCIGKIYKTEFLRENKCYFTPNMKKSEDTLFVSNVIYKEPIIAISSEIMYFYRRNKNSMCNKYNPLISEISNFTLNKIAEEISFKYPDNKKLLNDFYEYKVTNILIDNIKLDICNKDNNDSYKNRKQKYDNLIKTPLYKKAIKLIRPEECKWSERRLILYLIKKNNFMILDYVFKHPVCFKIYGKSIYISKKLKGKKI